MLCIFIETFSVENFDWRKWMRGKNEETQETEKDDWIEKRERDRENLDDHQYE